MVFFLDIGAHDGVTYSNSYFFEKERNWTGICIEPIEKVFKSLVQNRNCIKVNCAISEKEGEEIFLKAEGYAEMLSGLKKNYNKNHIERLQKVIKSKGGKVEEVKVKTRNINNILIENNIKEIDFCSIDTEGSELMILETISFEKFIIKSLSVENNYKENSIGNFLKTKGYIMLAKRSADEIYIKKDYFNKKEILKIKRIEKFKRFKTKIKSSLKI